MSCAPCRERCWRNWGHHQPDPGIPKVAGSRVRLSDPHPPHRFCRTYGLGYNYRLDEMSAALGRVQMSRLDELLVKRERVAAWYQARLAEMPGVELLQIESSTSRMSWFVYVVRLDDGIDRKKVAEQLDAQGVPTRPYFTPIHLQRYMTDRFGYKPGDYPVTEDISRRSLALPFSGTLSEDQVERVCDCLVQTLKS